MTPEIKKKMYKSVRQSEIFRRTQNMKNYFVLLMWYQITRFWAIWKSRHRHSNTNKSPLEIKVLYIFVKHVIVNKVATYRLGAID